MYGFNHFLSRGPKSPCGRTEYLLMLSHRGSHSGKLERLLGAHPEIYANGKRPNAYTSSVQLRLLGFQRLRERRRIGGSYIYDKILHNGRSLDPAILGRRDVRMFVLLGDPEASMKHLLAGKGRNGEEPMDPRAACEYYCARLRRIMADTGHSRRRVAYLDTEALFTKSEEMLTGFQNWLWFETPLVGWRSDALDGDNTIRDELDVGGGPAVSSSLLREATGVYRECREELLTRCVPLTSALAASPAGAGAPRGEHGIPLFGTGTNNGRVF